MSKADQEKWDERYADGAFADRTHPSVLLVNWIDRLPKGRALDIACGAGRNSLFLARKGFEVTAIDISGEGLRRAEVAARRENLKVAFVQQDLDAGLPRLDQFQAICLFRYLNQDLIRALPSNLAAEGILLVEEHLATDQPVIGPSNPKYRVQAGQLPHLLPGMSALFEQEGLVTDPDGRTVALARFVGTIQASTPAQPGPCSRPT